MTLPACSCAGLPAHKDKIENILIQSRKFSLPGKKKLLDNALDEDLILMNMMESPIERPTKHQKRFYSGKQKEHTLKSQVVFGQKSNKIMCLAHSKGKWKLPKRGKVTIVNNQVHKYQ